MFTSIAFGIVTYLVMTYVIFGGPLHGIFLLSFKADHLAIPGWQNATLASFVAILGLIYSPLNRYVRRPFRFSTFIAAAIVIPTFCIVLVADLKRSRTIAAFGADDVRQYSLFHSLSRAPADFQFYLHAAVLKDCQPYAWSYRTMTLYPLSRNVAPNVVSDWSRLCGITIDR